MALKTVISLHRVHGDVERITLNYDDATTEVIAEAAVQLIQRHRLVEGDSLTVTAIDKKE